MAWPVVELGEFCDAKLGKALNGKAPSGSQTWPYLRNINVRWGSFDLADVKQMHFTERERAALRVGYGDLLLCEGGEVGRCAIWREQCGEYYFQNAIHRVRPDPARCITDFLYYQMRFKAQTGGLREFTTQATIAHLSGEKLAKLPIVLPPLAEQQRIVDILDRAAAIQRLRKAAEEKAREIIPALFIDMFGDPASNPKGWPVLEMRKLFSVKPIYGTMAPASEAVSDHLCIRVANIQNDRLSRKSLKYVSSAAIDTERHLVREGDLLMARAIASLDHLGKCIVAKPGQESWAFDSHIMRCRFATDSALPEYVVSFLQTESGRTEFLSHTRQSAVQYNINSKEFGAIRLPVPPVRLQADFERKVKAIGDLGALNSMATNVAIGASNSLASQLLG